MFKVKKGFTVIEIAIVVAIVALLAGVWYVSKSKTGADIVPPGGIITGTTGITPTGGVDPAKMGMGTIKGQVTNSDGTPADNTVISFTSGKCGVVGGDNNNLRTVVTGVKGFYKIGGIPPGDYCAEATTIGGMEFSTSGSLNLTVKFGETKEFPIVLTIHVPKPKGK